MVKEKFEVVEDKDGIVIYDESDDYDPGEEQIIDEDDELDIDYILREAKRQEAQAAEEKRKQRWVSAGVIVAVVAFIAGICYWQFKNIL